MNLSLLRKLVPGFREYERETAARLRDLSLLEQSLDEICVDYDNAMEKLKALRDKYHSIRGQRAYLAERVVKLEALLGMEQFTNMRLQEEIEGLKPEVMKAKQK